MVGTLWDNNSCAYDAVVTTMYNLWLSNPPYWSTAFINIGSPVLSLFTNSFNLVLNNMLSLDAVRDRLREYL
ncbi:hypothetical protein BDN72DRAFT_774598, partial [Pluteus cervinus]